MNFNRRIDEPWSLNEQLSIARSGSSSDDHPNILYRQPRTRNRDGDLLVEHQHPMIDMYDATSIIQQKSTNTDSSVAFDTNTNYLNQIRLLPMRRPSSYDTNNNSTTNDDIRALLESVPMSNSPFASELMTLDHLISSVLEDSNMTTQKNNEIFEMREHDKLNRMLTENMIDLSSILGNNNTTPQENGTTNNNSASNENNNHQTEECPEAALLTDSSLSSDRRSSISSSVSSLLSTFDNNDNNNNDVNVVGALKKARFQ